MAGLHPSFSSTEDLSVLPSAPSYPPCSHLLQKMLQNLPNQLPPEAAAPPPSEQIPGPRVKQQWLQLNLDPMGRRCPLPLNPPLDPQLSPRDLDRCRLPSCQEVPYPAPPPHHYCSPPQLQFCSA